MRGDDSSIAPGLLVDSVVRQRVRSARRDRRVYLKAMIALRRERNFSRLLAVAAFVGLASFGCASHPPSPPSAPAPAPSVEHLTVSQVVAKSAASVVIVRTPIGLGTGFVVGRGLVATNLHVVAGAGQIVVATSSGKNVPVSAIAGLDATHDLALLILPKEGSPPPLPLRGDAPPSAGDAVIAIGTPQGLAFTVSTGIVSAVREVGPKLTLVQTTAPISPGSSGGPLLDDGGRVIGVTTLISRSGQNLNFAVPSQYLVALLAQGAAPITLSEFAKLRWARAAKGGRDEGTTRPLNRPPFPDSVAGFRVGESMEDAHAACHAHWRATVNHAECGAAPVELPFASGPVFLYFSRDHLVAVELVSTSLENTRTALVSKYGPADDAARTRTGREQVGWRLNGGTITVSLGRGHLEVLYTSQAPDVEANY
jgi:S1-C subfamily serine protease